MAGLDFNRKRREDPVYVAWIETQNWFEQYGKIVGIAVVAIAILGAVGFFWQKSRAEREATADVQLAETRSLYWNGDYVGVIQRAQDLESQYAGTNAAVHAKRVRGDALFWQGDFKGSILAYEAFLAEVKFEDPVLTVVQENLAQAYESDGQHQVAAELYAEAAAVESPRTIRAERLMKSAYAWREAGNDAEAKEILQRISREYGDTPSYRAAELALGEMGVTDS